MWLTEVTLVNLCVCIFQNQAAEVTDLKVATSKLYWHCWLTIGVQVLRLMHIHAMHAVWGH